jgi:hypothetical protein
MICKHCKKDKVLKQFGNNLLHCSYNCYIGSILQDVLDLKLVQEVNPNACDKDCYCVTGKKKEKKIYNTSNLD